MPFDLVEGKTRDLGGFTVSRLLPSLAHRAVGPFVFFDHLGPATLARGNGVSVRPHPHIGLATVTYLFEGELVHRDSLGNVQAIRPGDVNWMTAGRGIVHSERSPEVIETRPLPIHAIQSWVAVPVEHEEGAPAFAHHPATTLPGVIADGVRLTLIAGTGFGRRSPVAVLMPTIYAAAKLDPGATLTFDDEHRERGVYVVDGDVTIDGAAAPAGQLAVLAPGGSARITARGGATLMLLGGAALDGPRALEWNFVASRREAIDAARADWSGYPNARFPQVPGETTFIPLPERPPREPTVL
jgi:redox-sensitive bicupin YhaK (pirin superfamily)